MFYLHSSADHAFVITRRAPSNAVAKQGYSFSGSDEPVSWESVRIVKQLVTNPSVAGKRNTKVGTIAEESSQVCPICLDSFVAARITICGHCFCLACALRHIQTSTANNPYQHVKCPCCAIPMVVGEMRPVIFEYCQPPVLQKVMKLVKLHRTKNCAAPYLPVPDQPKHSNPHAAPCMTDPDSKYCRFNYIDPMLYMSHLESDQKDLQGEIEALKRVGRPESLGVELTFYSMALDIVLKAQKCAQDELVEEQALMERFSPSSSGIYQPQSPDLVASNITFDDAGSVSKVEESTTYRSDESPPSPVQHGAPLNGSPIRRYRGDSIGSYQSVESSSSKNSDLNASPSPPRRPRRRVLPATMYLDEHASHFYQAEDGQLVFLNGFNMNCLQVDASKNVPRSKLNFNDDTSSHEPPNLCTPQPPLPDYVDGIVLEIDTVHITPEIRKRMPFMAHLPLYTDIVFVELDLNNTLSDATKHRFKAEFTKRRKRRQSKVQAEKRADRAAKKEEEERIQERKARLQLIDPDDEFFRVPIQQPNPVVFTGDNFGPAISENMENNRHREAEQGRDANSSTQNMVSSVAPVRPLSFSQACRRTENHPLWNNDAFPTLGSSTQAEPFPALSSSDEAGGNIKKKHSSDWGHRDPASSDPPYVGGGMTRSGTVSSAGGKKKKKGGKKLVLFATGGQRGSGF